MKSVIDASVALKLVLNEPGQQEAVALIHSHQLTAPDVFLTEIANGLAKRVRSGKLMPEEARKGYRSLSLAVPNIISTAPHMSMALDIAMVLNHPVADCVYLALARSLGWPMVTADLAFVRVAREAGYDEVVPL